MDYKQNPKHSGSIDGFSRVPRRRPTYHQLSSQTRTTFSDHQQFQTTLQRQVSPTFRTMQTHQQPSKINSTLPNPQFSRKFSVSGPQVQPKYRGLHFRKRSGSMRQKRKWFWKRKFAATFAVIIAIVIGAGGWLDWNLNKVFHCGVSCGVQALFSHTTLNGEAQGRVNVLLAGYQGSESDEGPLTDSIMIVSIDTKNHTAFTMSIPRDLWVNIPGLGSYQKINAANTVTSFKQPGYFQGGMGQLQQIVEQDFGIPIDYYALIDYTAFEDAVNAVGGITVNIQSPDPQGLYDPNVDKAHGGPVKLPNGPVTLNGLQALALALARGDSPYAYGFPQSDINREQHQRQMLVALGQKAASAGVLTNPLSINHLFSALGNNIKTDLSLQDALRLAQLAHEVNLSKIQSYGLNYAGVNPLLKTYVAPDGEDSLIPKAGLGNYSQIRHFYLSLTSNNPVVRENASVVVLNASNVNNLAHKEASVLQGKGFDVTSITDANTEHAQTMIINMSSGKDPASLQALEQLFPGQVTQSDTSSSEATEAQGFRADFVVVLGKNWDTATQ